MDVPKYRIVFRKPFETALDLYQRCKEIKAAEKLSGYFIYMSSRNIATKYLAYHINTCYDYMILMKGPRAKCYEFFNGGEYERHAAEFVEKIKTMNPICIRCDGVYCEDGVYYQQEAALYYYSNAMRSMHDFLEYHSDNVPVRVNKAYMDSEHWVKFMSDDRYYVPLRWPGIRVAFSSSDLRDIDHDRWFSYMRNCYSLQTRCRKMAEDRLHEDAAALAGVCHNMAKIYDQFSDSEKLMLELDMR